MGVNWELIGSARDAGHLSAAHASQRRGLPEGTRVVKKEGIMVTHDYVFAVLFMIAIWLILHEGGGHSLRH